MNPAQKRGYVINLSFSLKPLEDLRDDRAYQDHEILVQQVVHRLLFNGMRTIEKRNPNTSVNEDQPHLFQHPP